MREGDAAGDSFGLDGFELVDSPASVERFLDDFVGGGFRFSFVTRWRLFKDWERRQIHPRSRSI